MSVRALVADAISPWRCAAADQDANTHGSGRSALAGDSQAGLLESAAAAARTAYQRLRIHAPVEPDGRSDRKLSSPDRRVSRWPGLRSVDAGGDQGFRLH